MNDIEIDKALALAIGHKAEDMFAYCDCLEVSDPGQLEGRAFSHLDWNVIGPIAEQYNCFPSRCWPAQLWRTPRIINGKEIERIAGDTPQQAIALAVIASKK